VTDDPPFDIEDQEDQPKSRWLSRLFFFFLFLLIIAGGIGVTIFTSYLGRPGSHQADTAVTLKLVPDVLSSRPG